jgi:acetyl esterase/lipase
MRVAIYALLGPDLVPRAMPGLAASGPSRDWHIILQRRPFGRSVRMLFEKHLVGRLLTSVVVATLATSLAAQQSLPPQPASIEGAAAHVYKTVSGIELRLHVFSPGHGNSTAKPAVVFFFGGAWTSGTVTQFVPQARHLTDRGMVAVIADYRVFGRHQTSPFEAVADAKSAVRWLRTHAPEFGVDPSRIVASGGSSGGHIALSAATFDAFDEPGEDTKISSKPDALVLFNPAVDTSRETPPVLVQGFAGRGRELSPLHHLRRGVPPTLILHGKSDATVPYSDVERFCTESRALGNHCELIGYEGAPHGFFNPGRGGTWHADTLQEMDAFLTRLGYLAPGSSPRRNTHRSR